MAREFYYENRLFNYSFLLLLLKGLSCNNLISVLCFFFKCILGSLGPKCFLNGNFISMSEWFQNHFFSRVYYLSLFRFKILNLSESQNFALTTLYVKTTKKYLY